MAIKHYKPTTPGRHNMTTMDYSELSKVAPERSLLEPIKKNAGHSGAGTINSMIEDTADEFSFLMYVLE